MPKCKNSFGDTFTRHQLLLTPDQGGCMVFQRPEGAVVWFFNVPKGRLYGFSTSRRDGRMVFSTSRRGGCMVFQRPEGTVVWFFQRPEGTVVWFYLVRLLE